MGKLYIVLFLFYLAKRKINELSIEFYIVDVKITPCIHKTIFSNLAT